MKEVLHRNIDALSCSESKEQVAKQRLKAKIKSKDQEQGTREKEKRNAKDC